MDPRLIHWHIAARKVQGPIKVADQHNTGSRVARFNSRVALLITAAVGTMWCAYLFTALAFISFGPSMTSGSLIVAVGWVTQTFLQLVLLSVILVGQNVQAAAADKRADQTYYDAEAILHEVSGSHARLDAIDARLDAMAAHDKPMGDESGGCE